MSKYEADGIKRLEISKILRSMKGISHFSGRISWGEDGSRGSIGLEVSLNEPKPFARLYYTITRFNGDKREIDYGVPILNTPCHFGKHRYWFECPIYNRGIYCGRRVGTLYGADDYFACRHCYNLTYSSRKTNSRNRYNPIHRILWLESKIERIEETIYRSTHAGKPTKKQRRLDWLYKKLINLYRRL